MENKNGRGIFLGVVSVATLIVAIIGATFAYFSASITSNEGEVSGETLDLGSSALSLSVTKLTTQQLGGSLPTNMQNLVPAAMTETQAGYTKAVNEHCENSGYTGCHVYEIDVNSANALDSATLLASLTLTGADTGTKVDTNWSYALLQKAASDIHTPVATEAPYAAPTLTQLKEGKDAAQTPATATFHRFASGATQELVTEGLTSGHTYYYLVVYLLNTSGSQNNVAGDGNPVTDETGSYSGTVTLKAAGGQVKATFTVTP